MNDEEKKGLIKDVKKDVGDIRYSDVPPTQEEVELIKISCKTFIENYFNNTPAIANDTIKKLEPLIHSEFKEQGPLKGIMNYADSLKDETLTLKSYKFEHIESRRSYGTVHNAWNMWYMIDYNDGTNFDTDKAYIFTFMRESDGKWKLAQVEHNAAFPSAE